MVYYLGDSKYICGPEVTYPDFLLFELCDFMEWLSQGLLFERNPTLLEYHKRMRALPRLCDYYTGDGDSS